MRALICLLASLAMLSVTSVIADDIRAVPVPIEKIEQLGGTVTRDDELPGKPVTGIYFRGSKRFSHEYLHRLKSLPDLRMLVFDDSQITDAGLKELKHVAKLTLLDLGGTTITDAGLKDLGEARNLRTLILYRCARITDAGLKELVKLEELTALDLRETRITDAGLRELAALENLTTLDLRKTAITDLGLRELQRLPNLKYLDLGGCRQMTEAGLARLKDALPMLDINRRD